jgi:hypothetical protein
MVFSCSVSLLWSLAIGTKVSIILAAFTAMGMSTSQAADDAAKKDKEDMKTLHGSWVVVSGESGGQLLGKEDMEPFTGRR